MSGFRGSLDKWKQANGMNGPQALPRFVMFQFLDRVSKTSKEFVFKGGHLLWVYINTPRPTVDLDFVTQTETDAKIVLGYLVTACENKDLDIHFNIFEGAEIREDEGQVGVAATVGYKIPSLGIENKFDIDIVLGVQTDIKEIKINNQLLSAASMENIICDKFLACRMFGSGNTRAKDYDDLYRIAHRMEEVNLETLRKLIKIRNLDLYLNEAWVSDITVDAWGRHLAKYRSPDLPKSLHDVFEQVNQAFSAVKA